MTIESAGHRYPANTGKVNSFITLVLGYLLPSMGESKQNCGTVRFSVECEDCGSRKLRLNHCDRALCPICYQVWARKAANRVANRMWSAHNQRAYLRRFKPRHIVLSIPPSLYHLSYNDLLARGLKLMKSITKHGGGLYIGHPWRFVDINGQSVQWKHCSLNKDAIEPIVEAFQRFSPHLHFIMWGRLEYSPDVEARTGWIYRTLGDLHTREDVFACTYYQLSHCGIHATRHALRWWGFMSYNNFLCVKEDVVEQQFCSECGGRLWVLDDNGLRVNLYAIKVTKRHFKFKVTQTRLEPKKRVPRLFNADYRHKGR